MAVEAIKLRLALMDKHEYPREALLRRTSAPSSV